MKVVVGIDLAGHYERALSMLLGLGFKGMEADLVHTVEPLPTYIPELGPAVYTAGAYAEQLHTAGEAEVKRAEALVCGKNLACRTHVLDGSPAPLLMDAADSWNADLIAVGSAKRDRISAALFGSVGRALAVSAEQSILVVKGNGGVKEGPYTAVFATDHSEYANKCVEKLLSWAPKGLRQVQVVHAYETTDKEVSILETHIPEGYVSADDWIAKEKETKTKAVAQRFEDAGIPTQILVARGHANDVIRTAMGATKADLLILGAQGHGFLKRLLIGSVSLHQVVVEPYSVLVVRA